ncbi:hypothetical protein [Clostridium lundense]|nr:hypothetical protein [Clostridium lundense]
MHFGQVLGKYGGKVKNKLNLLDYIYSFVSMICVYLWINLK